MANTANRDVEVGRVPLSRDRILAAAIALADADGLESLSMRRLAQALRVEAMSLYHYFASKTELLAGMLDTVYGEFARPSADFDWRDAMRRAANSAHETLLRHAWACTLVGQPMAPGPLQFQWMDSILGRLRRAGFSAEMTHHAYHALDSHIVGFTLWLLPYLALASERPELAEDALATVSRLDLPHLAEHIKVHQSGHTTEKSEFEFGLDLLLDSLERIREEGTPRPE